MKAAIYATGSGEIRCIILAPEAIVAANCLGGEAYLAVPPGISLQGKIVQDGEFVDDPNYVPPGE